VIRDEWDHPAPNPRRNTTIVVAVIALNQDRDVQREKLAAKLLGSDGNMREFVLIPIVNPDSSRSLKI
jgi:hypothetical protein